MTINKRIDALMAEMNVEPRIPLVPVKQGNKRNVVVGGQGYLGQRFPVSLYAPSWLWLLREENIETIITFLEENKEQLSWGT